MMVPGWKKYFDPPTLAELSGLALRRSLPFDGGALAGSHRSSRHGHSVEFAEHRPYVPGDDLRSVDWKIFGRTDRYFLRSREDETTLVVHFLLDASASMAFAGVDNRSAGESKFEYAARAAATLAFITVDTQDLCSLSLLSGEGIDLPTGGGEPQLQAIVEVLSRVQVTGADKIGGLVCEALTSLSRQGVVVIVSDLLDDREAVQMAMRRTRSAGHDLLVIQVLHPEERVLPIQGSTRFEGMEGESPIDLQADAIAEAYEQAVERFAEDIERECRAVGGHFLPLTVGQPMGPALAAGLHAFYG